jgi:hypothetical protein
MVHNDCMRKRGKKPQLPLEVAAENAPVYAITPIMYSCSAFSWNSLVWKKIDEAGHRV